MKKFKRVILFGRRREDGDSISDTLERLQKFLQQRNIDFTAETETAQYFDKLACPAVDLDNLDGDSNLIICVGGDGTLLQAGRKAIKSDTPVLGINRGRLGFLTDIKPSEIEMQISDILDGNYHVESRFLLEATTNTDGEPQSLGTALNDVVLLPGLITHMVEFEIYINSKLVCQQRADGLIVATPTGSTAYALSGGGPILHPKLDAVVLVPMFPHTLSSRPIVITGDSEIRICITEANSSAPNILCDGQERIAINPGSSILITKKSAQLRLIHSLEYNYYETLRSKLGWQSTN